MDTCVFCSRSGDDFQREHWVPKWISRAVVPKLGSSVQHNVAGRSFTSRAFELTVKHVCNDCNGHWMSDMETRNRDVVLGLMYGNGDPPATPEAQEDLAAWCFLKAITCELGRPDDQQPTYPLEMYRGFYVHKTPPPLNAAVWIGRRNIVERESPTYVWWASGGIVVDTGEDRVGRVEGYRATFLIGHFVFRVSGLLAGVRLDAESDERYVTLWPVPGAEIVWPPPNSFVGVVGDELI